MGYLGMPSLLSKLPAPIVSVLGSAISSAWASLFSAGEWGIYNSRETTKPIKVTSVISLGVRSSATLSDYPLESGSFATYNKVKRPADIPIRITREGSEADLREILKWLEAQTRAISIYDVVTPEVRYPGVTLVEYTVQREASNGALMVIADCIFQQVKQLPAAYSGGGTKNAQDAATQATSSTQTASLSTRVSNLASSLKWR